MNIWGKSIPGRRNSKYKGLEAGRGRCGWSGVMEGMSRKEWVSQVKEVRSCRACWVTTETLVLQDGSYQMVLNRGGTEFDLGFNRILLAFGWGID